MQKKIANERRKKIFKIFHLSSYFVYGFGFFPQSNYSKQDLKHFLYLQCWQFSFLQRIIQFLNYKVRTFLNLTSDCKM